MRKNSHFRLINISYNSIPDPDLSARFETGNGDSPGVPPASGDEQK
jgi:hypothetical protein